MPDFTPRPTVYKGVKMRSRLEAGYAEWLDRMEVKWEYEPCAFATEEGQYLPDFLVSDVFAYFREPPEQVDVFVEVKSAAWKSDMADVARTVRKMRTIWASRPNAYLLVHVGPPIDDSTTYDPTVVYLVTPLDEDGRTENILTQGQWTYGSTDVSLGLILSLNACAVPWPDGWWKIT